MCIVEVVGSTRFDTFPVHWRNRGEYDGGSAERVSLGAAYFYYNIN